ncbi:MAG TPA: hypothetical protein VIT20_03270 [Propionibacteriaceae bacterium]
MSAARFDLHGLSRAIEASDLDYQLNLYAETADVRVVDRDRPRATPEVIEGKPAIRRWLEKVYAAETTHLVMNSTVSPIRFWLSEECHRPDGDLIIYTFAADVLMGQIVQETVTLTRSRSAGPPAPRDLEVTPEDATSPRPRARVVEPDLPGQFLG